MRRPIAAPEGAWLPVLFDALGAGRARLVARLQLAARQQQPGTLERPPSGGAAGGAAGGTGSVTVADRPAILAATRTARTPIESLSLQARAEPLEGRESEPEPETLLVCEIASWRGYVKRQFYVKSQSPLEVFSSPYFRARGNGAPERTDAALRAHAPLVEKLIAAGWEQDGRGEHWYSERFRRALR